jgi:hypothetical protein
MKNAYFQWQQALIKDFQDGMSEKPQRGCSTQSDVGYKVDFQ